MSVEYFIEDKRIRNDEILILKNIENFQNESYQKIDQTIFNKLWKDNKNYICKDSKSNIIYCGQLNSDNQLHGQGILFHQNGKVLYDGRFSANKWHSNYAKIFSNQGVLVYNGSIKKNLFEYGCLYDFNGNLKYKGTFKSYDTDNQDHVNFQIWFDQGYHVFNNLMIHKGKFMKNLQQDSNGIISYWDKFLHYVGETSNGMKHGDGKIYYPIYCNGDIRCNKGSLEEQNCFLRKLSKRRDQLIGKLITKPFSLNSIYQESYDSDKLVKGSLIYKGKFEKNYPKGEHCKIYHPILCQANSEENYSEETDQIGPLKYEGKLVHGLRQGQGKQYKSKGQILFDGEFANDKRFNGFGYEHKLTFIQPEAMKIGCSFLNTKIFDKNGFLEAFYEEGQISEGIIRQISPQPPEIQPSKAEITGNFSESNTEKIKTDGIIHIYNEDCVLIYIGHSTGNHILKYGRVYSWKTGTYKFDCVFPKSDYPEKMRMHIPNYILRNNITDAHEITYKGGYSINRSSKNMKAYKEGLGVDFHANGKIKYRGYYKNNSKEGIFGIQYNNKGGLHYVGAWSTGMFDGKGILYDTLSGNYDREDVGRKKWYTSIWEFGTFKCGNLDGPNCVKFDMKENKIYAGKFVSGNHKVIPDNSNNCVMEF